MAIQAPFPTGGYAILPSDGSSSADPAIPPPPPPDHVVVDIPCAGTPRPVVVGATAPLLAVPYAAVLVDIPTDAAAGDGPDDGAAPPATVSPFVRELVRTLWLGYVVLGVPALVLLQAVTQKPGLPFLKLAMFFAAVFMVPMFALWIAVERERMKAKAGDQQRR